MESQKLKNLSQVEKYCLENNVEAQYNFPSCEKFCCVVVVGKNKGIGFGASKDQAQENAQEDVLKDLSQNLQHTRLSCRENQLKIEDSQVENSRNFIGLINEHCLRNNLLSPEYSVLSVQGEQHNPLFHMKGIFHIDEDEYIVVESKGKTKKQGKQAAAEKIFNELENRNLI